MLKNKVLSLILASIAIILTLQGLTSSAPPLLFSTADQQQQEQLQQQEQQQQLQQYWTQQEADTNSALVSQQRDKVVQACHSRNISKLQTALDGFVKPPASSTRIVTQWNERNLTCPMIFLDLGANVGDSLGKLIDSGIPECHELLHESESAAPRWNRTTGRVGIVSTTHERQYQKHNALIAWTRQRLERISTEFVREVFPEEYCYVGVEGNPRFSQSLQQLQRHTLATRPRPVRAAYFYTETVVTNVSGPTVLYLDTVNRDENFWGSSIFRTHVDIQASAVQTNTSGVVAASATVTGVTLTALLQRHVLVSSPLSSSSSSQPSHVLIKMDIEGGEFAVLNEAFDSGYLCQLATLGVFIDLLVEVHPRRIIGPSKDRERFHREVKYGLRGCGITIQTGLDADG